MDARVSTLCRRSRLAAGMNITSCLSCPRSSEGKPRVYCEAYNKECWDRKKGIRSPTGLQVFNLDASSAAPSLLRWTNLRRSFRHLGRSINSLQCPARQNTSQLHAMVQGCSCGFCSAGINAGGIMLQASCGLERRQHDQPRCIKRLLSRR